MQQNIEKNKLKNSISHSFIWGFEEPENGVEYLSCFEMADDKESAVEREKRGTLGSGNRTVGIHRFDL